MIVYVLCGGIIQTCAPQRCSVEVRKLGPHIKIKIMYPHHPTFFESRLLKIGAQLIPLEPFLCVTTKGGHITTYKSLIISLRNMYVPVHLEIILTTLTYIIPDFTPLWNRNMLLVPNNYLFSMVIQFLVLGPVFFVGKTEHLTLK